MANQYVNKVVLGSETLLDLTADTATAADVAQGKTFHLATGAPATGTASGGGGGGATNMFTGTFTPDSAAAGTATSLTIPYTGAGFPIMAMIVVADGMYNPGNTTWNNAIQKNAIGFWAMAKNRVAAAPTYAGSGGENNASIMSVYKNSTTSGTTYARDNQVSGKEYTSDSAKSSYSLCARFNSNTTLSYFTAASSFGFMSGIEYRYFILYSE